MNYYCRHNTGCCWAVGGQVTYYHVLFETHEVIYANPALCESFHPNEVCQNAFDQATLAEIFKLFPKLEKEGFHAYGKTARPALAFREANTISACS